MALDRQGTGLAIIRVALGAFFIAEGLTKYRWFLDASILASRFNEWPGLAFFARLVPLGEICSGIALLLGFWTPLVAFIAFFMALNYQVASGAIFRLSFLTSGYGLPVLGSTLGLAIGGVRLPRSVR